MEVPFFFVVLYSLGGLMILWLCQNAFCVERTYLPRQPAFTDQLKYFPTKTSILLWKFDLALLVLLPVVARFTPGLVRWAFLLQGLWGIVELSMDRFLWSPNAVHFTVCALSIGLGDLVYARLFSVSLYFFGGLQKLNSDFGRNGLSFYETFFQRQGINFSDYPFLAQPYVAYLAAGCELLFALALCFPSLLWMGLVGIPLTHISILLACGPWGSNSFQGVWGWNIFCAFQPYYLFAGLPGFAAELWTGLFTNWSPLLWLAVLSFVVVPALNALTGFGERLSFKMHSANFPTFTFFIPNAASLPEELEPYLLWDRTEPDWLKFCLTAMAFEQYSMTPPMSRASALLCARQLARVLRTEVKVQVDPLPPYLFPTWHTREVELVQIPAPPSSD